MSVDDVALNIRLSAPDGPVERTPVGHLESLPEERRLPTLRRAVHRRVARAEGAAG